MGKRGGFIRCLEVAVSCCVGGVWYCGFLELYLCFLEIVSRGLLERIVIRIRVREWGFRRVLCFFRRIVIRVKRERGIDFCRIWSDYKSEGVLGKREGIF